MLMWEFSHAAEAINSGIYVTWSSGQQDDCVRVGAESRCFCGHLFKYHEKVLGKKATKTNCNNCPCKNFRFVPRRPEEVGLWWLPRRKGFDVNQWRASCTCTHTHEDHAPNNPNKCKCGCYGFQSDFACLTCDKKWEDHDTLYELESERAQLGKTIREQFKPLSSHPEIQRETMIKLGMDMRSEEEKFRDELRDEQEQAQIAAQGGHFLNVSPGVNIMIPQKKSYAPKQDVTKPERSVLLMQQKGLGGQKAHQPKAPVAAKGGMQPVKKQM